MSVWIIYEETYTVWTESEVQSLEICASEDIAMARIIEICRQEAEERLAWALRENDDTSYEARALEARIKALREGSVTPSWYDVGMVADENGVEVWTTRQRTVEEEIKILTDRVRGDTEGRRKDREARVADLRAQLAGEKGLDRGDWKVMEKEVIGAS